MKSFHRDSDNKLTKNGKKFEKNLFWLFFPEKIAGSLSNKHRKPIECQLLHFFNKTSEKIKFFWNLPKSLWTDTGDNGNCNGTKIQFSDHFLADLADPIKIFWLKERKSLLWFSKCGISLNSATEWNGQICRILTLVSF